MTVYKERALSGIDTPEIYPGIQGRSSRVGDQLGPADSGGRPNLGINEGTLGNWLNKAKRDGTVTEKPLSVSERAEFEETKKQLQRVKMERDFLKKAAAWFAGQNQ